MEGELDGQMDSLTKLSASLISSSSSSSAADLEAGPLLGEAQMVDRLQDEIKAALGTPHRSQPLAARALIPHPSPSPFAPASRAHRPLPAERLASINDEMQQASDGSGKATNLLHRHREILADKQAEFRRTRDKISSQRKSQQLLSSVRKDITCAAQQYHRIYHTARTLLRILTAAAC
jgi:hypothetical protein